MPRIVYTPKDFPRLTPMPRFFLFINRPPSTSSLNVRIQTPSHLNRMSRPKHRASPSQFCKRLSRSAHTVLAVVLALSVLLPGTAYSYDLALTPSALHDAWVLGQRNDQSTAEFLDPYSKQIAEHGPGVTPHLSEIDILTPFAQVVDESRQKLSGFTEQQANQAYHHRGDTVVVRVRLVLPSVYPNAERGAHSEPSNPGDTNNLRPENFWQKFKFDAKQHGKVIATRSVHNLPVYSAATKNSPSILDGQTVWLEYDAKNIANDEISIEVSTPDGQTNTTLFDLRKLR
jgi:hypothetical protein